MPTLANAHLLYTGLKRQPSYTKKIHVRTGDPEDKMLRSARRVLRSAVRTRLNNLGNLLTEGRGNEIRVHKSASTQAIALSRGINEIDVRFLSQGSFTYGTLVRPAQPSEQEIDLDDGIYVPIEFLNDRPVLPSEALFYAIEKALEPIMAEHGWALERKATCVRVSLTGENAHIDLPLFAVQKDEFSRVEENFQTRIGLVESRTAKDLNDSRLDGRDELYRIGQEKIFLAHREDDWIASDPKAFQDWFEDAVERFGAVLRRTCRYVKSWRDHHFATSSLSSMALMVVCFNTCVKLRHQPADNRDDILISHVAKELLQALRSGQIVNPLNGDHLDKKISPAERAQLIEATEDLVDLTDRAINGTQHKQVVVNHLRACFGDRLPNEPDAVSISPIDQAAPAIIRAAETVPAPQVGTSTSG